jgi:hypothetical protein
MADEKGDLYSPDNDFFRAWYKDELGRDCRVGLSFDETQEHEHLVEVWLQNRTQPPRLHQKEAVKDNRRYRELHDRHERARHERLADPSDTAIRTAEFLNRKS